MRLVAVMTRSLEPLACAGCRKHKPLASFRRQKNKPRLFSLPPFSNNATLTLFFLVPPLFLFFFDCLSSDCQFISLASASFQFSSCPISAAAKQVTPGCVKFSGGGGPGGVGGLRRKCPKAGEIILNPRLCRSS